MEDQAASLRRLTPAAQVGRSFAFLGVSGCGVTTMVSEMAAGLTAAQRRTACRRVAHCVLRWRASTGGA